MTDWIDISVPLHQELVSWPESIGYSQRLDQKIGEGSEANVSHIHMDVHTGTHIDAPLHFIEGGKTLDQIPLSKLIGPCWVVDCGEADEIGASVIQGIPEQVKKVLFKTRNSRLWADTSHAFSEDFVALTLEAAEVIAARRMDLVGVDYLSIQKYHDSAETHRVLLSAEVVLLESINLTNCVAGEYELHCFPLKLHATEAAPCRVLLKKIG